MTALALESVTLHDAVVDLTVITSDDILFFEEDFGDLLSDAPYWPESERRIDTQCLFDPQNWRHKHLAETALAQVPRDTLPPELPDEYWRLQNQLMRLVVDLASHDDTPDRDSHSGMSIVIDTRTQEARWVASNPAPNRPALPDSTHPAPVLGDATDPVEDALQYAESILDEFQEHFTRFDQAFEEPGDDHIKPLR